MKIFLGLFVAFSLAAGVRVWAASDDSEPAGNTPQPAAELIVREQETQYELPEDVRAYMKRKRVPEEEIGVYVHDVNADAPLLVFDADTPRNPASTMKVVTTWAALKKLKPSWTWNTEAWIRGSLEGHTLEGDLILKGYGDPFLVYEIFWQIVHDIRLKGIHDITGDIIIDNSFFDLPPIDPGAFDNRPGRVYNAPPSALMFNFQATRFLFTPNVKGEKIDLITQPRLTRAKLENEIDFIRGRCRRGHYNPVILRPRNGKIVVKGKYADGCGQREIMRLVSTPEQHAYNAFTSIWADLGGKVGGTLRSGRVKKGDERFHVHTSRPLGEQIRLINKWSNNVMTRQLLLSLGGKRFGAPATLSKGRMAILEVLQEQGVDTEGFVVDNGSGLSRDARISPRQLGQLLKQIWRDPYMPELLNSLPLLGEDGTLSRRFRNSDMQGRSRLKTGTLRRVTAIAGYMLTRSGKRMIIVMQHNGKKAGSHGRAVQNRLLEWVFEH